MPIGDRIAERRKALGMTQDELALRMGYKSKAAISKIETNVNDITQSTVVRFAEVLDTTIAYLMGWENTLSPADSLSPTERRLVSAWRQADEKDRRIVAATLSDYGFTYQEDRGVNAG